MTDNQDIPLTNQTQFMGEEPLYESPVDPMEEPSQEAQGKIAFFKTGAGKVVLVGGGILILFLIVVLIVALTNRAPTQEQVVEEVQEEVVKKVSPLQGKIDDLQDQLDEADPTKSSLSFPPVDLNLEITEK